MGDKKKPGTCGAVISLIVVISVLTASHGGHDSIVPPDGPAQCVTLQLAQHDVQ